MKTAYSITEVEHFLSRTHSGFVSDSVKQLVEGHTSQVFSFETSAGLYVIRIRDNKKDFEADIFAFQNFSEQLPIPEVFGTGTFDDVSFYAIAPYIDGDTLNTESSDAFTETLPNVKETIAKTFQSDISAFTGYGNPYFNTGNAVATTWKNALLNELEALGGAKLSFHATNIGLPEDSVAKLINQFKNNLPYVSEYRRLLHGDPGGDNMIINNGKVVALLDWEQMSYGDWLRDFSRFEFWSKNDYGDTGEFAAQYNLESEHLNERKAVYWAIHALRAIEFADVQGSEKVAKWMRSNIERILF